MPWSKMSVSPLPIPAATRYGGVLFVLLLAIYGGLFALWASGDQALYAGVLRLFGVLPHDFPFLDLDNVFAAAECQARGIDPILTNPCDVLGRTLSYPPTWLVIVPAGLGRAATPAAGIVLDVAFLAALAAVLRPGSPRELALGLAAGLSGMVMFAMERGNIDSIIFLLCAGAAVLWGGGMAVRMLAYAVMLLAGLLKYYPLVLLGLAMRERVAALLAVAAAAAAVLLGFWLHFGGSIRESIARVARGSPFHDLFAARNLPDGLAHLAEAAVPGSAAGVAAAVFVPLLAWAGLAAWRHAGKLGAPDLDGLDARLLLSGAALLVGCFFAGQSIGYRGIFLLLVLPGVARGPAPARMVAAVLALMWGESVRVAVLALAPAIGLPEAVTSVLFMIYWIGRELLWWWLIGRLGGILLAFARTAPLLRLLPRPLALGARP